MSPRDLVRMVISLHVDAADAHRQRTNEERRPLAELVREAVRSYLEIEE